MIKNVQGLIVQIRSITRIYKTEISFHANINEAQKITNLKKN